MEKKKINVQLIIIVILVICLIGTSGFIVYDKFIKDNSSVTDSENDIEGKLENGKVTITPEIEAKVTDFTALESFGKVIDSEFRNKNVFDDAYVRVDYVTHIIQTIEKSCMWTSGATRQETPYVLYDTYKKKYESIYGDLYNLETDLQAEYVGLSAGRDCDDPELSGGNYICWMGTRGVNPSQLKMELNDKNIEDNTYILSGTYNIGIINTDVISETGTFEIKYVIENNDAYLSSFIMTPDK